MLEVKDKQHQLQQSLNYYQTNMGIEELARKRLGYYKDDEISIRLIKALPKP